MCGFSIFLTGSGFAGWILGGILCGILGCIPRDFLVGILGDPGCVLGGILGGIVGGILSRIQVSILGGSLVAFCVPKCYAGSLANILGDILGRIQDDVRGGF